MTPIKVRLNTYEQLLHLDQVLVACSSLFPTLTALWLASNGRPEISMVIALTMSAILSSAGCSAVGEWANARKGEHPSGYAIPPALSNGAVYVWEALVIGVLAYGAATLIIIEVGNKIAIFLQVAAFVLTVLYVILRHFLMLPHLLLSWSLGLIYSAGIPVAYALVTGKVDWYVWAYMGINMLWVTACDLQETIRYRQPAPNANPQPDVEPIPSPDDYDSPIMVFLYSFFFIGMAAIGVFFHLGLSYWIALVAAAVFAILWSLKIRNTRPTERYTAGFSGQQIVVIVLFIGVVVDSVIRLDAFPILH